MGGGQIVKEGVAERGQGGWGKRGGARGLGQEGWGKGDGPRGGVRGAMGVESIF